MTKGYRVFKINGRPILIRGGGWAPDMFLRPSAERETAGNPLRQRHEPERHSVRGQDRERAVPGIVRSRRHHGHRRLVLLRFLGAMEPMEGRRLRHRRRVACAIRSAASAIILASSPGWYGSDDPPNARAEKNYLAGLQGIPLAQFRPIFRQPPKPTKVGEPTGIRMTGPYEYVPPMYWYVDTKAGGAYCFNTETSPGPADSAD